MNHQRHVIREAIVAALAAGGTSAGARVYDSPTRVSPAWPSLIVEDVGEAQDVTTLPGGPLRSVQRQLQIDVVMELQQQGAYARERDQLCADVERIVANLALAGVKQIVPAGYQPDRSGDGERPIAVGRQRFQILYVTPQGDPSTTY